MRLSQCHNFRDVRDLARRRLPGPIFGYVDGAADDKATLRRNPASFDTVEPLPHALRGVKDADLSVTVTGQKRALPFCPSALLPFCPSALRRPLCTGCFTITESVPWRRRRKMARCSGCRRWTRWHWKNFAPRRRHRRSIKVLFHKDRGRNHAMMQRAKAAGVEVMVLTVDSITGGNRGGDMRLIGTASVADLTRDNLRFR